MVCLPCGRPPAPSTLGRPASAARGARPPSTPAAARELHRGTNRRISLVRVSASFCRSATDELGSHHYPLLGERQFYLTQATCNYDIVNTYALDVGPGQGCG